MEKGEAIEALKTRIQSIWQDTRRKVRNNISRGHSRVISTDVEDSVAIFICNMFDDKVEVFIDPTIKLDKTHRPDILVIKDNKVIALLELKSSMGYCRDARDVIKNEIIRMHHVFCEAKTLNCMFSNDAMKTVSYNENVSLFLVALSAANGVTEEQIAKNKACAIENGIKHYLLFDGWYDKLKNRDIGEFAGELINLKNNAI